ncbi:AraC-type DNA-binding protein [Terribacillus halophilus]|uniref:AraC-type DNA-binding protein n=1 Tax=Terribacillus halophilus TaxID=361279 RepID=A0A1G6SCM7_9BACI|nr:AraC family transcriptional regulator [Terribacillus halophilus]SDD14660.1 AraC-type DNA-binding protein [Terribacillus halophilus]
MQNKEFLINQDLEELTQHRTVELPVACYETTIKENIHGHIPLHWHNEVQFVQILNGSAVFQINEEKVMVNKGEGIFINSGCLHKADDYNNSDCIYICLNASPYTFLSKELHTKYVSPYIQATNLTHLHIGKKEEWERNILKAILEIHQLIEQKNPFYEIVVVNHLNLIWQNLIMHGMQLEYSESEMQRSQRMKHMLNWIHLHSDDKINLADIAKAGKLSRAECCRYFKRIVKQSPMNYVMEYRINRSLSLLQDPSSNVTEVAYQVGFNSSSYFIAKFRESIGMTPLAYKKQQQAKLQ